MHAAEIITPPDPVVFEHIGDTHRALGNIPQALTYWQKALNLDPQNQGIASKIEQSRAHLTSNPTNSPPVVVLPDPSSAPSP
jgi:tetratricopeptide (TPR) repeat protein